jgi:xylulokinase
MPSAVLGVDIGTSSSKGVLVDLAGVVLATAVREHEVSRPRPGWVEMDTEVWWDEFVSISSELTATADAAILAVGVSGMGPCVAVTDADGTPLRPAILYGVDTRAGVQIERLNAALGEAQILDRCGSALSSQAAGPKLAWIAENEPEVFARARRLFMPSSWLAWKLSGSYVLDHESASQCTPLYDTIDSHWYEPWAALIAPELELPALVWADDVVGTVSTGAASATGLPAGIPVVAGTIDAWTEAVSVDAQNPGDLMLMYGTTMFLVNTIEERITVPALWGTVGAFEGTRNLAGGMATSGAITSWLRGLFGAPDYATLLEEAALSGPGAHGLLMLPYFAGERTPVMDPDARGTIIGLTLSHTRGDLYRAALEATALGIRHNIEAMRAAGADIRRVVAVGGGTQGALWTQIVSDVIGLPQVIPSVTIGASYGAAFLAATAVTKASISQWNPASEVREPEETLRAEYDSLYALYLELYPASRDIAHALAERERMLARRPERNP